MALKPLTYRDILPLLKRSLLGFINDRALKLSASLSYYTVFSIAPLILLVISLAGFFLGKDAIQGHLFREINDLIGAAAAAQIQEVIRNMSLSGKTTSALVIGIVTLIVGATTVFGEIQDSINIIWRVKAKPKRGWLKLIQDRLLSSSLIIGLGFLMVVTLMINGLIAAFNDWLMSYFPDTTVIILGFVNFIVGFMVIWLLFSVIFKVLPDAEIHWRDVRTGSFFTACLFMLGRYLISLYIESSGSSSAYGAAGSLIIILLWVYYTAAILYFGAEFTRAYTEFTGARIEPSPYAVYIEEREIERVVDKIPPKEIVR